MGIYHHSKRSNDSEDNGSCSVSDAIKHPLSLESILEQYENRPMPVQLISTEDVESRVIFACTVTSILSELSPLDQDIFKKCILRGDTIREYSRDTGIPKSTVADHLQRIRKNIKKFF